MRSRNSYGSVLGFDLAMMMVLAMVIISYADAFIARPRLSTKRHCRRQRQPLPEETLRIEPKPNAAASSTSSLFMVAKTGAKIIETTEDYSQTVLDAKAPRPVLVFFTAPWCGPCRLSVPVVKEIMKQFAGKVDVVELCTDDLAEVAESCGVVSIPTIQLYHCGHLLDTIVGCVARSVLANAVEKVLEDVATSSAQSEKKP